jgi:NAD(P)-dependent dehydrogenase (short-subunit alcohol dehydrogenase family)
VSLLTDRIIVVTGAGRGLGRAFAGACGAEGARVVIAEIDRDRGNDTADALARDGVDAWFTPLDIADGASVAAMADAVEARYGRIHGLVNNAALATGLGGKGFEEIEIDAWDRVMAVNVRGMWLVTKACVPLMDSRMDGRMDGGATGGAIVNLASDTALWGASKLLHYVASKGAVIAMTRSMARELGEANITVNAVAPGLTRVEATADVPRVRHELYEQGRALKRAQHPDDITGAVVFLLSDGAAFITGQTLAVNGGFVMH